MLSGIVDDALGAVLDKEFEKLKTLQLEDVLVMMFIHDLCRLEHDGGDKSERVDHFIDLTPFFSGFVGEAFVDHGHDLVEQMAVISY